MYKKIISTTARDFNQSINQATYSDYILDQFPTLRELATASPYRFKHTFILLDSMNALIEPDINIGYSKFKRLAERALNRGEHLLSLNSFTKLRNRVKPLIEQNLLFTTALCSTHDYGCRDKNKVARHFVYSGIMCRDDFTKLGFNEKKVEAGALVVGNHSYLGDFLLGESTVHYSYYLEEQFAKTGNADNAFDLLWLLTVLDINGAGDGFVSEEKLNDLWSLSSFEQLRNNYGASLQDSLKNRVKFLNKNFDASKVDPSFNEAYMQYLYDIVMFEAFNRPENAGIGEQLLSYLGQFCSATHKIDAQGKPNYIFISFASGEKGTDVGDAALNIIQRINAAKTSGQPFDLVNNTFLGYAYSIDPTTGYLLIQN